MTYNNLDSLEAFVSMMMCNIENNYGFPHILFILFYLNSIKIRLYEYKMQYIQSVVATFKYFFYFILTVDFSE